MVIGNGMVAKKFAQYLTQDNVVIFASGVSNSKSVIQSEFDREKELLCKTIKSIHNKKLIYFSTFNLYDPNENNSPYCLHKLNMENLIKAEMDNFNIFRLGHVAGQTANQYTILSYLYDVIKEESAFNLWKYASRNIIDIEDISKICSYIIDNNLFLNQITNVCNDHNTSILDIVKIFEDITSKKGKYTILDKGGSPDVDNTKIQPIAEHLRIVFNDIYVQRIIYKYYNIV
jgi:nucleoside-diphosphate-sugar epimerase